jgi:transcription elongation factor Elf1
VKAGIVARRLRKSVETGPAANPRETVVCGNCGQRFAIHNDASVHSTGLAEKQAAWVQDQLVWDHIQERKHHGSIELPDLK